MSIPPDGYFDGHEMKRNRNKWRDWLGNLLNPCTVLSDLPDKRIASSGVITFIQPASEEKEFKVVGEMTAEFDLASLDWQFGPNYNKDENRRKFLLEKEFEEAGGFAAELTSANVEDMVWKGSAGEKEYTVRTVWFDGVEPDSWGLGDPVCRYVFPEESNFSEETCETVHNLMSAPVAWDPHSGLEDPRS